MLLIFTNSRKHTLDTKIHVFLSILEIMETIPYYIDMVLTNMERNDETISKRKICHKGYDKHCVE